MRRSPETIRIDLKDIEHKVVEHDPDFLELFKGCVLGKNTLAATRISIERIQSGFTKLVAGTSEIIESPKPTQQDILALCLSIMTGQRHQLHIYKSSKSTRTFVCSDDLAILKAYKVLKISKVPVFLINADPNDLEECALEFRYISGAGSRDLVFEREILPSKNDTVPTILGLGVINQKPELFSDTWSANLSTIENELNRCLHRLRRFHQTRDGQLHYHHCLASVLSRASRIVHCMKELLRLSFSEQALILLRSLYELALLLHLDWLNPNSIGSYIAVAASLPRQELTAVLSQAEAERIQNGWSKEASNARRKSDAKIFLFIEKVSEKAKISPLRSFHKELYHYLSSSSHQDFSAASDYMNAITSEVDPHLIVPENFKYDIGTIVRFANFSAAHICSMVSSDIGVAIEGLTSA